MYLDKFYNDFVKFQATHKNFATNTIGKHVAVLKVFINDASRQGIEVNQAYKERNFKVITEETESVYLTENELNKIYLLELSHDTRLDRIKDIFLLACYTGLRYSDVTELKTENIQGEYLNVRTKKTNTNVIIPIHKIVKEIISKYNGLSSFHISNQKLNDYMYIMLHISVTDDISFGAIFNAITKDFPE